MCAATVEVLSKNAVVKHRGREIGKGPGTYDLRNFDPDIDVYGGVPNVLVQGISSLTIEFGRQVGRARVGTREHDTDISVEASRTSAGIGKAVSGSRGRIIFDETYGFGPPSPAPIVDSLGNTLAIVNHKSVRNNRKRKWTER